MDWMGFPLAGGEPGLAYNYTVCFPCPTHTTFYPEESRYQRNLLRRKEVPKSQHAVWGDRVGSYNFVSVIGWKGSLWVRPSIHCTNTPSWQATDSRLPFSLATESSDLKVYLTCYALEIILVTVLTISQGSVHKEYFTRNVTKQICNIQITVFRHNKYMRSYKWFLKIL